MLRYRVLGRVMRYGVMAWWRGLRYGVIVSWVVGVWDFCVMRYEQTARAHTLTLDCAGYCLSTTRSCMPKLRVKVKDLQ